MAPEESKAEKPEKHRQIPGLQRQIAGLKALSAPFIFGDRLMVGQRPLKPLILVRIHVPQFGKIIMNKTSEFSFILKPSKYGVGVFAAHDIKKGTFLRLFGNDEHPEEMRFAILMPAKKFLLITTHLKNPTLLKKITTNSPLHRKWHRKVEGCAFVFLRLHPNFSAVRFYDVF